jgi:hypothetical protein
MHQERAKIHLRAFIISKNFRGLYPRTPVAGGDDPLPHTPPTRLRRARGALRPRFRRPRFSLYPHVLSYTPPSMKSWEIAWRSVFSSASMMSAKFYFHHNKNVYCSNVSSHESSFSYWLAPSYSPVQQTSASPQTSRQCLESPKKRTGVTHQR